MHMVHDTFIHIQLQSASWLKEKQFYTSENCQDCMMEKMQKRNTVELLPIIMYK